MTVPTFAANTYSYMLQMSARESLDRLARQGFREFELMAHPGHFWPSEMDRSERNSFRRYVLDAGLHLLSLNMANVDLNIASTFPEMRAYSLGVLESLIGCAGDLGIAGVVIAPGKPNMQTFILAVIWYGSDQVFLSSTYWQLAVLQATRSDLSRLLVSYHWLHRTP
jgi:sugar phosphate isomerase/epimerase